MKEKFMKKEKGITLIALVITIIVLLILAGVAISMLSGENGILTRASEAKEKTETASMEEEMKIAMIGALDEKTLKVNEETLAKELKIGEEDIIISEKWRCFSKKRRKSNKSKK